MNPTVKTILIWVLILVAAVSLYTFIERSQQSTRVLSLDELIARLDRGDVTAVTVNGSNLQGVLSNEEPFETTLPAGQAAIFERLTEAGVLVTVLPDRGWLGSFLRTPSDVLLLAGLTLWIAISTVILMVVVDLSKFVKRHLRQSNA
jgi:ATP-dependent Zn protease